jgi:hypothetical protein
MIGSDSDGESLNAARMALRLIKDRGLTWDDVLVGGTAAPPEPKEPSRHQRRKPEQQRVSPYTFLAGELLGAFGKKRRVSALDLSLVNRALNPFYVPTMDEARRIEELFIAEFGASSWQQYGVPRHDAHTR